MMKTASLLFTILISPSFSWVSPQVCHRRDATTMMGSRGAKKWERKKEWLEKRGFAVSAGGSDSETTPSSSSFCTIIGGGRIGSLLEQGGESLLLKRGDAIPEDGTGPIFIATRNDSLQPIVDACPPNRLQDLVFLQNGYLDKFLTQNNLMENTQVLLYLSVASMGAEAVDGITTVNPEGLTAATGMHAEAFKDRLAALDLKCNVVSMEEYKPAMFEKLIWISTYMLVGTAKECQSVGQASTEHSDLIEQVVTELVSAVSQKENIQFQPGTMERLKAYTDVVADFPVAVKEFEWRNQYFYDLGDDACPMHNSLLRECQEKGKLGFELP